MKQWLMLCVLPGQLMGEVFVTVPFAKPIPKFTILYHSCRKKPDHHGISEMLV